MNKKIIAYFDGCCEPVNPGGHGGAGYKVFFLEAEVLKVVSPVMLQDKEITSLGDFVANPTLTLNGAYYLGKHSKMSNNVAEYEALHLMLKDLNARAVFYLSNGFNIFEVPLEIRGDSKLVINQLNREWRVKGGLYYDSYLRAQKSVLHFKNAKLVWIPGKENLADENSRSQLKDRNIVQREYKHT